MQQQGREANMQEADENYVPCKPPVEKGREKGKIKKNGIQSTAKRDKCLRAAAFKIPPKTDTTVNYGSENSLSHPVSRWEAILRLRQQQYCPFLNPE